MHDFQKKFFEKPRIPKQANWNVLKMTENAL